MELNKFRNESLLDAEQEKKFITIKWLHFWAGLFFLIQTIAYSVVDATAKVNPTIDKAGPDCQGPICGSIIHYLGEVECIWLIPVFVALAFFDHFVSFLYCHFNTSSSKHWIFTIGSNPFRWVEYSISASFMAVAIAILSGITDVHLWLLIFVMHGIGMFFGLIMELLPKEEISELPNVSFARLRSLSFWLGSVSIFTPWLVIGCYFFRAVGDDTPDFVYAAFLGTFVLFLTFGANSYLHNVLGMYQFPTAEIVYISLSFTAKTFLAADVFGGLNASNN